MARLLYITYGPYRVGLTPTSSAVELEDRYSWESDENEVRFSFQVKITAATPALFNAARAAFATAVKTPDQALTVVMDSDTRHTYDPAANTGLNPRGAIRKVPGRHNTARSGRFVATIALQIPMDASGRAGRRSASVVVSETVAGRQTCTISATYTAATAAMTGGSARSARAQYNHADGMEAFSSTTLSGLGGSWELLTDDAETDQNDKLCRGVRVYRELKYNQGVGTLDVSAIKAQNLVIDRTDSSINDTVRGIQGSSWSVSRLRGLEAQYSCAVDFDATTDLPALWAGTILPRIDESVAASAQRAVIRTSVSPDFDPVENRITATVRYLADVGGAFFQMRESLAEQVDEGHIIRNVWDGQKYSGVLYQGPGRWTRTLTRQYTTRAGQGGGHAGVASQQVGANVLTGFGQINTPLGLGFVGGRAGGVIGAGGAGSASQPPSQGKGWLLMRTRSRETPFTIGQPGGGIALEGWTRSWVWIRFDDVSNRPLTGSDGNVGGTRV